MRKLLLLFAMQVTKLLSFVLARIVTGLVTVKSSTPFFPVTINRTSERASLDALLVVRKKSGTDFIISGVV